eukprot:273038_1
MHQLTYIPATQMPTLYPTNFPTTYIPTSMYPTTNIPTTIMSTKTDSHKEVIEIVSTYTGLKSIDSDGFNMWDILAPILILLWICIIVISVFGYKTYKKRKKEINLKCTVNHKTEMMTVTAQLTPPGLTMMNEGNGSFIVQDENENESDEIVTAGNDNMLRVKSISSNMEGEGNTFGDIIDDQQHVTNGMNDILVNDVIENIHTQTPYN